MQLAGSLAVCLALPAVFGHAWAVWPAAVCALVWLCLWLSSPGALAGVLLGLIAAIIG